MLSRFAQGFRSVAVTWVTGYGVIRGWFQYYGQYYRTELYSVIRQLDQELVKWARQKYKKLREHVRRARQWVAAVPRRSSYLFAHWTMKRGGSLMGAG